MQYITLVFHQTTYSFLWFYYYKVYGNYKPLFRDSRVQIIRNLTFMINSFDNWCNELSEPVRYYYTEAGMNKGSPVAEISICKSYIKEG
ncbi:hypothetical protein Hamer_G015363 [Homarus americanus]|uniref:Uncharacterized protein n=1 Tax=Homarus americanus TaxID=6706 RepID=A0A8J5TJB8_HOMAM|nr:hypothetical protein Hamer_G015363 [Homarus americanus]